MKKKKKQLTDQLTKIVFLNHFFYIENYYIQTK